MMTLFLLTFFVVVYLKSTPKKPKSSFVNPRELLRKKIEGTWRLRDFGDSHVDTFESINVGEQGQMP